MNNPVTTVEENGVEVIYNPPEDIVGSVYEHLQAPPPNTGSLNSLMNWDFDKGTDNVRVFQCVKCDKVLYV